MSDVHLRTGRLEKSRAMLLTDLGGLQAAHRTKNLQTLESSVVNLATCFVEAGELERADEMDQRALVARDRMRDGSQQRLDCICRASQTRRVALVSMQTSSDEYAGAARESTEQSYTDSTVSGPSVAESGGDLDALTASLGEARLD